MALDTQVRSFSTSVEQAHAWVDHLDAVADEFAEQVVQALRRSIRAGSVALSTVAAAVEPEPIVPPSPPVVPLIALDELVSIERAWREEVSNVVIPAVEKFMRMGADHALEDIAQQAPVLLDMTQPAAELHLVGVRNRLTGVGEDLWEKTRDELVLGMQDGESIPQLSKRVRGVINSTEARAKVIARTEVIGASNAGTFIQMTLLPDPPTKKVWLATRDDRTRLSHLAANGQTVPLLEQFKVGGATLRFPGDPQGPPGEVIQCRCTLLFDFDDSLISGGYVHTFHLPGKHDQSSHGHGSEQDASSVLDDAKTKMNANTELIHDLTNQDSDELALDVNIHAFHLAGKHNQAEHGHGGSAEGKKKLAPAKVDTKRLNAAESAELAQIEADHKAGKLSDKEAKYKTYYVKVKASKRINKSDAAKSKPDVETKTATPVTKIGVGDTVNTPAGKGKVIDANDDLVTVKGEDGGKYTYPSHKVGKTSSDSGEVNVGDKVNTPKGEAEVVSVKDNFVTVQKSNGQKHTYGKSIVSKKEDASSSITDGDKVITPSGKEGTVLFKNSSGTAFVKMDDGDEFAFNEGKLTKVGQTAKPPVSSLTPSPTKITGGSKTTIKPSQLQPHHYNTQELQELHAHNKAFAQGGITEKQYKSKVSYLKYKVAKRVNASNASASTPTGVSTKVPPVSTSPGPAQVSVPGTSLSSFSQTNLARQTRAANGRAIQAKALSHRQAQTNRVKTHGGTDEEKSAFYAHRTYTGSGYGPLNHSLRTNDISPQQAKTIKGLDSAFKLYGVTNENQMTVYRGVRGKYAQRIRDLTPGTVISDKAYTSTTVKTNVVKGFKGSEGVAMRINVPAGKRSISGTDYESELIFNRGTTLKFTGQGSDGAYEFDML